MLTTSVLVLQDVSEIQNLNDQKLRDREIE